MVDCAAGRHGRWLLPWPMSFIVCCNAVSYVILPAGESSEEASGSDEDVASWISWFCSLKGNEFFCEVEEDFIQDDFNLSGLSSLVTA